MQVLRSGIQWGVNNVISHVFRLTQSDTSLSGVILPSVQRNHPEARPVLNRNHDNRRDPRCSSFHDAGWLSPSVLSGAAELYRGVDAA